MKNIEIKIRSFEAPLVDEAAKKIVLFARKNNVEVSGPVPLPTKFERITILRSVHVNKKSREQFESRTHKRLIVLKSKTDFDQKFIYSLKHQEISAGVEVEVVEKNN